MSKEWKRRLRQRQLLHWAQSGHCAGCGRSIGLGKQGPRSRPTSPTFDHVLPKSWGGHRVLVNGLLKHRACNERRADEPPTGCDRVWQGVVLDRLASRQAADLWGLEVAAKATFVIDLREPGSPALG